MSFLQRTATIVNDYMPILQRTSLFSGISAGDLLTMLKCLGVAVRVYAKGQIILEAGSHADSVGVVLFGEVRIVRLEANGQRNIISKLGVGGVFSEAYACVETSILPVTAEAATNTKVMFLNYRRVVHMCPSSCHFHQRLISNMLSRLAEANLGLNRKMAHMSRRTIREKLQSYLAECAVMEQSQTFSIPFSRQELADYLSVDRSALSTELGKMRNEGLLETNKSQFTIHFGDGCISG